MPCQAVGHRSQSEAWLGEALAMVRRVGAMHAMALKLARMQACDIALPHVAIAFGQGGAVRLAAIGREEI